MTTARLWRWIVLVALVAYFVLPEDIDPGWHGLVNLILIVNAGMLVWDGVCWLRRQLRLAELVEVMLEVRRRRGQEDPPRRGHGPGIVLLDDVNAPPDVLPPSAAIRPPEDDR